VSSTFVPLAVEGQGTGFEGTMSHVGIGQIHLVTIAADPHVVRRTKTLIRRADPEFYKLSLQISGHGMLSQGDRQALLSPGDFVVYDTSEPYELAFAESFRMVVLMFPRALMQVPGSSMRQMVATKFTGASGLGSVISPFIMGLAGQAAACSVPAGARMADAVIDMLSANLMEELTATDHIGGGAHQAVLLRRIRAYIEENLSDPDLDPTAIARAHHISPRYLRKLFEAEGDSVARWVRARRLEHCRRDLPRVDLASRTVSAVGASWGLTDAAHFSRLFKATYGLSPREYRSSSLGVAV
jgi:AraC-like DNA-binding protein